MMQDNTDIGRYYQQLRAIDKLFLLSILLISIDGTPIIPIDTNHKPLSILIILCYWSLQKVQSLKIKLSKTDLKLLSIFGILWAFTLLKGIISYQDLKGLIKFTLTGGLSFFTISACLHFFQDILNKFGNEGSIEIIAYTFLFSLALPIVIGIIQFLGITGLIPHDISNTITLLFSYRPLGFSRIQMLNTEPSHAANYTVLVLIFTFFYLKKSNTVRFLILASIVLLLLIINSSASYVILLLTIVFYFLLCTRISLKTFSQLALVSLFLFISIFSLVNYFASDYTKSQFSDLTALLSDLSMDNINTIILINFSIYDRIFTPILGFLSLKNSYFLGLGGESFFYNYLQLVDRYFPSISNSEIIIRTYVDEGQRATPKFLFAKIASEFGIIALIIFSQFIVKTFKRLNLLKNNYGYLKGLCAVFIFAILSTVNASYFNITFIMLITLTYSAVQSKEYVLSLTETESLL